jgi:hypothetical protein
LGNQTDARRLAERARPYAKTPQEIGKIDEFLRYLDRGPAGGPGPQAERLRAEGSLQTIECLGATVKLHVVVGGKKRIFLIADPSNVHTKKSGAVDVVCGEQKGGPVIVEYTVNPDASLNVEGIVRSLEIQ